jgi:trans-2,3-dihydro-3-hydroxyanthranilate isomerase
MPDPRSHRYRVVDVFTRHALEGNPLAVFPDASGIDDLTMQRIARELNLSETVFVLPATRSGCAWRLRIFTPTREMVFAGHPTVGGSFVLLDENLVPRDSERFVLDEKVGPVTIRVERGDRPLIWLTTPPIYEGETFDRTTCAQALGLATNDLLPINPQLLSAGNPNIYIPLKDKEAVDRASIDVSGVKAICGNRTEPVCIFVFAPTAGGAYSRMFAPELGLVEDPATGSATGPLALFMMKHQLAPCADGSRFESEQGTKMGRRSILHIQIHGETGQNGIEVGGYVTPLVEATMTF